MAFQAAVGTWFAVHILARVPVGGRFGLSNSVLPVSIRLETGNGLDDIEVTQSDGSILQIQSKTTASLSSAAKAPLTKTGAQLADWAADTSSDAAPVAGRDAAILAVRSEAPKTLNVLEAACRAFDLGGGWTSTRSQRNSAQREALDVLEEIVTAASTIRGRTPPTDADLACMARLLHIARFSMDEGDADWREVSRLLGSRLYGDEVAGDGPLRDLRSIVRDLIGNGAPADRTGLLRALRARGHIDTGAPRFDQDIAHLRTATTGEMRRLTGHGALPVNDGITINRECDAPLASAISSGSLLVVGEPGAGKTGALIRAAEDCVARGEFVAFLSVDRFTGVAIEGDLASELRLDHRIVDVLSAVPGPGPKFLFVDALDAARGGPPEGVFASLIERAKTELEEDWRVVASIRTFDLRNGRRFRSAFRGAPADSSYADASLGDVRHFCVPRLCDADLASAGSSFPAIAELLAAATPPLRELLRNAFNLSLATRLLSDGTNPAAFAGISTQSSLIDVYEDQRMPRTGMTHAAADTVNEMTRRKRLTVRKVDVRHADLDEIIQAGILESAGDVVSFAHHVLFDHVAGRYHLAWDDPARLISQLEGDSSAALLLAPALRFAVERIWRGDSDGRPHSWQFLVDIFSAPSVDPVLANVAIRIAVESVADFEDLGDAVRRVVATPDDPALAKLFGRLSRFVAMDTKAATDDRPIRAIAWASLAERLACTRFLPLVDSARVILYALFEQGDLADSTLLASFGRAARAMLEFAWLQSPPLLSLSSIATYGSVA